MQHQWHLQQVLLSKAILAAEELQGRRCSPRDELVRAGCSLIWVSSAAVHSWVFLPNPSCNWWEAICKY